MKRGLASIKAEYERKYGHGSVAVGKFNRELGVVPTGSWALDYALGIGGWPLGHISQVFGPKDIGKTSMIGFNSIREAQAKGLNCGYVAVEPNYDPSWAAKNGVDIDRLLVLWPKDGYEAFQQLFEMVTDSNIGWVVFDSIGQVQRPSEVDEKGKPVQGGSSGLISWGIQRILNPCWTSGTGVLLINQIRDIFNTSFPGFRPPGGHALEHASSVIVQLKPGPEKSLGTGEERIGIGREITAVVNRNKMCEGSNRRAKIDYYSTETEDFPFGIDGTKDVISTAKRLGVLKGAAYYEHRSFGDQKLHGADAVAAYIAEHPESLVALREDVESAMRNGNG